MTKRVRPLTADEHSLVIDYFHSGSDELLETMGVSRDLLKPRDKWRDVLLADLERPLNQRERFYVGWELNGQLIGHSNISEIAFGHEARVHLHIWVPTRRRSGLGQWFFCHSLAYFMETFELDRLICEPRAANPAPNRLLASIGATLVRTYTTKPGPHCYEQEISRYLIGKDDLPRMLQLVGE